jgi:Asp-tRNA(Asn)/Glu-tRNA(Gln) amidotransferase A subunit family amidase
VDDFNRRAIDALRHAQQASGARSANAFARQMADRANGSPSASTYRRWITGEAIVPAWALEVAAEVAGLSLGALLEPHDAETPPDDWRARVEAAIGRLESEMIEVRQHVGLPWHSEERGAGAAPSHTVQERSRP